MFFRINQKPERSSYCDMDSFLLACPTEIWSWQCLSQDGYGSNIHWQNTSPGVGGGEGILRFAPSLPHLKMKMRESVQPTYFSFWRENWSFFLQRGRAIDSQTKSLKIKIYKAPRCFRRTLLRFALSVLLNKTTQLSCLLSIKQRSFLVSCQHQQFFPFQVSVAVCKLMLLPAKSTWEISSSDEREFGSSIPEEASCK